MEADLKTLQIDRSANRPPEPSKWAVRWIVGEAPLLAVDLGAGTGILSRRLRELGSPAGDQKHPGQLRELNR